MTVLYANSSFVYSIACLHLLEVYVKTVYSSGDAAMGGYHAAFIRSLKESALRKVEYYAHGRILHSVWGAQLMILFSYYSL